MFAVPSASFDTLHFRVRTQDERRRYKLYANLSGILKKYIIY